jgi:hypothetical protein
MAVADSQEAAERQVVDEAPQMRVLRSREIDLSDFPSRPKHWCVVVEHIDPDEEAKLPQHDDPESHCEREARELYAHLFDNPASLVTTVIEEFDCPACHQKVRLELPPPHEAADQETARCPRCRAELTRARGELVWRVGQ